MAEKKLGIHWQERGDDIVFHVGARGKRQTIPRQQFLQQFPKQPYHGIKEAKWAEYLDKNDKACAEFVKKYGG